MCWQLHIAKCSQSLVCMLGRLEQSSQHGRKGQSMKSLGGDNEECGFYQWGTCGRD